MNRWDRAIDLREQVRELTEWKNNGIINIVGDCGIQVTIRELDNMPREQLLTVKPRDSSDYPVALVNTFHGKDFFCLLNQEQHRVFMTEGFDALFRKVRENTEEA